MAIPRPKLAFRGRDRQRIKQLQNYLKQVQRMDVERTDKAAAAGIPATLFRLQGSQNVTGAITQLLSRCESSLDQKVSQQAVPPPNNPNPQ